MSKKICFLFPVSRHRCFVEAAEEDFFQREVVLDECLSFIQNNICDTRNSAKIPSILTTSSKATLQYTEYLYYGAYCSLWKGLMSHNSTENSTGNEIMPLMVEKELPPSFIALKPILNTLPRARD